MKTSENVVVLFKHICFILHFISCPDKKDYKLVYTALHKRFKNGRTNNKSLFQCLLIHIKVFMFNSDT